MYFMINRFTVKPGQLDAFKTAQIAEYERLDGNVDGALGNRLYVEKSGDTAVNIAYFESKTHYEAWVASDMFNEHHDRIKHMVVDVDPRFYDEAYQTEGFDDLIA